MIENRIIATASLLRHLILACVHQSQVLVSWEHSIFSKLLKSRIWDEVGLSSNTSLFIVESCEWLELRELNPLCPKHVILFGTSSAYYIWASMRNPHHIHRHNAGDCKFHVISRSLKVWNDMSWSVLPSWWKGTLADKELSIREISSRNWLQPFRCFLSLHVAIQIVEIVLSVFICVSCVQRHCWIIIVIIWFLIKGDEWKEVGALFGLREGLVPTWVHQLVGIIISSL